MKQFAFLLFLVLSSRVNAQEVENYGPVKKNISVEVGFLPFNENTPITLNALHGRFYLDNRIAFRFGLNLRNKSGSYEYPVTIASEKYINKSEEKYTVIGISPGFEYHLLEGSRVSPYIGFEIGFEDKKSNSSYDNFSLEYNTSGTYVDMTTTEYKNAWKTYTNITSGGNTYTITGIGERGYRKIGANTLIGVDVYLVKHLYLGFELGFGYSWIKNKEINITEQGEDDIIYPESTSHEFGLNVNNSIRLGFWF